MREEDKNTMIQMKKWLKMNLINKAVEANYISISRDPEKVAKIGKPFDIVLLGMGEDGHFASLLSEHIMQNPDDININLNQTLSIQSQWASPAMKELARIYQ